MRDLADVIPREELSPIRLTSLQSYLQHRKDLIAAREALFFALRGYLRPEQRPDAAILGDDLSLAEARVINDAEWVANPTRGYLTILENAEKGRIFRVSILQAGNQLRIGVRLPAEIGGSSRWAAATRLEKTFKKEAVSTTLSTGDQLIDWHFDVPGLYANVQNFEDAVAKVGLVFEAALHACKQKQ